jgi:hypothetical protein
MNRRGSSGSGLQHAQGMLQRNLSSDSATTKEEASNRTQSQLYGGMSRLHNSGMLMRSAPWDTAMRKGRACPRTRRQRSGSSCAR